MKCPKCSAEVQEAAIFCHKCGERLDGHKSSISLPIDEESRPPAAEFANADDSSSPSAAERFKAAVAGRQATADEPESELWKGGYATRAMIGAWTVSVLISIGLFALPIWTGWGATAWWIVLVLILLLWLYQFVALARRKLGVHYRLTSQRFFHESGILRHVTDRIETIDMDDVVFEQTILERLVGVGSIRITSSDRSHPELRINGIEDVKTVAHLIDESRHKERLRRGLHIESV